MSKTFKQGNYNPVHGISMKLSGCGPCASASVLCNLDGSINPVKVANWLYDHGHFYSSGTTRAGITDVLQKHGMEVLGYYKPEHQGGTAWKQAMAKMQSLSGDWWALFLTVGKSNGAKDNFWTSGGHYLSATDLKNGKLYMRDSGARNNTGYFDPEKLRYDTNVIWIIRKKNGAALYTGTFPTLPSKGYLKRGDTGEAVKRLQLFLQWYGVYDSKIDKDFGAKTEAAVRAYQKAERLRVDGWFGPACRERAKKVKK